MSVLERLKWRECSLSESDGLTCGPIVGETAQDVRVVDHCPVNRDACSCVETQVVLMLYHYNGSRVLRKSNCLEDDIQEH